MKLKNIAFIVILTSGCFAYSMDAKKNIKQKKAPMYFTKEERCNIASQILPSSSRYDLTEQDKQVINTYNTAEDDREWQLKFKIKRQYSTENSEMKALQRLKAVINSLKSDKN